jgi:hypothetical protein
MNEFHSLEHERLARAAVDDTRLMRGENPASTLREDALHWISVYGELAQFKQTLLDEMHDKLPAMSGVTAAEVHNVDIVIIREQMERYQRRIAFWKQREKELEKGDRVSANLAPGT